MKSYLLLPFILAGCASCLTKPQIQAYIWENNSNALAQTEMCVQDAPLWNYGFYRRITKGAQAGKLEFISFCNPLAVKWQAMYSDDLDRILDGLVPAPSPAPKVEVLEKLL